MLVVVIYPRFSDESKKKFADLAFSRPNDRQEKTSYSNSRMCNENTGHLEKSSPDVLHSRPRFKVSIESDQLTTTHSSLYLSLLSIFFHPSRAYFVHK